MQIENQNIYARCFIILSQRRSLPLVCFSHGSGRNVTEKAVGCWVWGPDLRSNGQKTNGLSSKSIEIPPILKTLAGYDRSRASYLGNLLSELRSDQTLLSSSRKPEKRLLLFQCCTQIRPKARAAQYVPVLVYSTQSLKPVLPSFGNSSWRWGA